MQVIVFRYKDEWSNGKWKIQECQAESVEQCKKFYGLGIDPTCQYQILSVRDVKDDNGKKTFKAKEIPVQVNPTYLKRKKLELIRDIEGWESAEDDSEDEAYWEQRMREDLSRLSEWEKKWRDDYTTVQELKYWLKEDLKNA